MKGKIESLFLRDPQISDEGAQKQTLATQHGNARVGTEQFLREDRGGCPEEVMGAGC